MENSNSREPAPPLRRAIIGALVGALGGALGAIFARPLLGAFRDSAPWILPVAAAAVLSVLILATLLLPFYLRHK